MPGFVGADWIEAEMRSAAAVTPFPPGYGAGDLTVEDRSGSYEVGSGRSMIEFRAVCAWYEYWLGGYEASNQRQRHAALTMMRRFPTRESFRSADASFRELNDEIIAGAERNEPAELVRFLENNCR
jgi:hypothetical protein